MSDTTRSSLAASFNAPAASKGAGKDRAAGLEGLLPARPRRDRDKPKETPTNAPEQPEATESTRPEPERTVPATPAAKPTVVAEMDHSKARTKPAYVPPATFDQAQAETKRRDITYTDLLVESFDLVSDGELAEAFLTVRPPSSGMPARVRAPRGSGGIQMNLRLDGEQERWLDQKQQAVGAPSRSALVSKVFQLAAPRWNRDR